MQIRSLFLLLAVVCSVAFVILNWGAIATPGSLSLGFASVEAPLGVVLLGILIVTWVLFAGYVAHLQTNLLIESRRHTKALDAQRELADRAEASRFTELRNFLDAAMHQEYERDAAAHAALIARLDAQEAAVRQAVSESGNGVAAHIGELEDRLERAGYRGNPDGIH